MHKIEISFAEASKEDVVAHLQEIITLIKNHNHDEGETWSMTECDGEAKPGPREYHIKVTCEQAVADDELDDDDRNDGPSSEDTYSVKAYTKEGAQELALDEFHAGNAIHCLDHYDIATEVELHKA
jgi:hypothetical protein